MSYSNQGNCTPFWLPNNVSIGSTSSFNFNYSKDFLVSSFLSEYKFPNIFEVTCVNKIDTRANKFFAEIGYKSVLFKDTSGICLNDRGLLFNFTEDIPAYCDKQFNYFWRNTMLVQTNNGCNAHKFWSEGTGRKFCTMNNFEEKISNKEMLNCMNNIQSYKDSIHFALEKYLDDRGSISDSVRVEAHSFLENMMI